MPPSTTTGTVKAGDTAYGIAQSLGQTPQQFLANNPSFAGKGGKNDYQGLTGFIQPGQSYNTGNQSTTTLSNANKIDQVPSIQAKTQQLGQSGITSDPASGISTYANGSVVPDQSEKEDKSTLSKGGYYNDVYYNEPPTDAQGNKVTLNARPESVDNNIKMYQDLMARSDAVTANLIAATKAQYDQIIRQQEQANKAQTAGATQYAVTGGQGVASARNVVSAQVNYGLQKVADLQSKEQMAIAQAEQAGINQDFQLQGKINDEIEKIRLEKQAEITKQNELLMKQSEELQVQQLETDKNNAIQDLYDSGMTDTSSILTELRKAGLSATPKEVSDSVALFSGIGGTGIIGEYNFYKSDAQKRGIIPVSFDEYQDRDANRKKSIAKAGATTTGGSAGQEVGGIYDQLDYRTANAVIAQGNQFGTSDIVKKYNNIVAASNLIAGVDPNTTNPAEHQAVIYNFAKALDPDSVVREGEYATVKKYSQSLINKYGGEIKQAIAGTGFLSPGAIEAIQEATDNRIKAYEPQYTNLKSETAKRINALAGKNVADIVLLDYEQGYSGNTADVLLKEQEQDPLGVGINNITNKNNPLGI